MRGRSWCRYWVGTSSPCRLSLSPFISLHLPPFFSISFHLPPSRYFSPVQSFARANASACIGLLLCWRPLPLNAPFWHRPLLDSSSLGNSPMHMASSQFTRGHVDSRHMLLDRHYLKLSNGYPWQGVRLHKVLGGPSPYLAPPPLPSAKLTVKGRPLEEVRHHLDRT